MTQDVASKPHEKAEARNHWPLVCLIVLAGLVLRLPTVKAGLWCDEMIALYVASQPSLSQLFSALAEAEGNPPFYHLILSAWIHFFGQGEVVVKIPSLVFGLLYIVATYILGRKVYCVPVGLLAAFCAALSPQANYFACQTRPHSLAALLICLALLRYMDLFNKPGIVSAIIFLILATASLYTSYLTLFLFFSLGVVTVLLTWRDTAIGGNSKKIDLKRLSLCISSLAIPCVLFAPWWPVVFAQLHGAKPVSGAPVSSWPLVFLYNLTTMIPVPLQVGVFLTPLFIILALVFCLRPLLRKETTVSQMRQSLGQRIGSIAPNQAFLLGASFIPATLVGTITPFFIGYFRYIFPFSAAFWVLIGWFLADYFGFHRGVEISKERPKWQSPKGFLVLLTVVSAIDLYYLTNFNKQPESGMQPLAADVMAGKYDHTAILVAPDHGAMTLDYYLPADQCKAHDVFLCGFPRWRTAKPETSGLPAFYLDNTVLDRTMRNVADLKERGFKKLVFANDHSYDNVENAPIGKRCAELKDALSKLYAHESAGRSVGITETSDLTLFDLNSAPAK